MELELPPAVNLARRVIEKFSLHPPIELDDLVKRYADLEYLNMPFRGVDGLTVDLKVRGKRAKVFVNSNNPKVRQRFTLAHELGHVLIPWHIGHIVDRINLPRKALSSYLTMEEEANTFAAELLMPALWLNSMIECTTDLANLHKNVSEICEVSAEASAIRLSKLLPQGIIFASERAGIVEFSGRTNNTFASPPTSNEPFQGGLYEYCVEHFTARISSHTVHWWKMPDEISFKVPDERDWRTILDDILKGLDSNLSKASINGIVAHANGAVRRSKNYNIPAIVAACIQRFKGRTEYTAFANHKDFYAFINKKAEDMYKSNVKK